MEIPAGYGNMTFEYGIVGDPELKTFSLGFRPAAGADVAALTEAAEDLFEAYEAEWHGAGAATLNQPWYFNGATVRFNAAGVEHLYHVGSVLVGTSVSETPIANSALLVKKRTGLAGRSNRGRMFVPPYGLNEAEIEPTGALLADTVNALQTQWDDFVTALAATDAVPYLLHGDGSVETPKQITSFLVDPVVATQRRRIR